MAFKKSLTLINDVEKGTMSLTFLGQEEPFMELELAELQQDSEHFKPWLSATIAAKVDKAYKQGFSDSQAKVLSFLTKIEP